MNTLRPVHAVEAFLMLSGLEYSINIHKEGYLPQWNAAGTVPVSEENWRTIAESLSNLGVHISFFEGIYRHPPTIFIYEDKDPDSSRHLSKYPPYTFKA